MIRSEQLKVGDKVTIVTASTHMKHVVRNYNKVLRIEAIEISSANIALYKIKGMRGHALREDLKLYK